MSENKYYTPEITEFCVGFEYELRYSENSDWKKEVFDFENNWIDFPINFNKDKRIKYLDSEDIKELGFEYGEIPCEYNGRAGGFVKKVKEGVELIIECSLGYNNLVKIKRWDSKHNGYNVFFWGNIKNKTELKKVLQMIGVL
jgi:hypothetical protein